MPNRTQPAVFFALTLGALTSCANVSIPTESADATVPDNTHLNATLQMETTESQSPVAEPQSAMLTLEEASFFSSYVSQQASKACEKDQVTCVDDPIAPEVWYQAMSSVLQPVSLIANQEQGDYEVLVACQQQQGAWQGDTDTLVEITAQWRGFALDTYTVKVSSQGNHAATALRTAQQWIAHAANKQVFTTPFLYASLRASNYFNDMTLPESLGAFQLQNMRLHANPFLGAMARYRHPEYEDALFDITVSPVMQAYDESASINTAMYLKKTIADELSDAQRVATSKDLLFSIDTPISDFAVGDAKGLYFSVHATDNIEEPLYAATYVFQKKDKLVKFTSSFPAQIASPLVNAAMQELAVPGESELMRQMRELIK